MAETLLAYDQDGNKWLFRPDAPYITGARQALGWVGNASVVRVVDAEDYLCDGLTGVRTGRLVRWDTPEAHRAG